MGCGRGGADVWELADAKLVYRMDKQQNPLHSTENCIQYPVTNHNGKEYEK